MSCCGCLETPKRITNLYRHQELLVKFTSLTGIEIRHNTFICDPCVVSLESCCSFKEKCVEIYENKISNGAYQEDEVNGNVSTSDEIIVYETEYIYDDPFMKTDAADQVEEELLFNADNIVIEPNFVNVIDYTKTRKSKKRSTYKAEFKLEAIEVAKNSSNRQAGKQLFIDESCIRKWRNKTKESVRDNSDLVEHLETSSELEGMTTDKEIGYLEAEKLMKSVKNRRKSYSSLQKLEVVSYAEITGNRQAAKIFSIDESCIRKWRINKELLLEINKERGTKRKPNLHWPTLDNELKTWAMEQMKDGAILKPSEIKTKSIEMAKSLKLSNFKGTSSYIFKFMERYKISPAGQNSRKKINKKN